MQRGVRAVDVRSDSNRGLGAMTRELYSTKCGN